jgi:hypothetical protein
VILTAAIGSELAIEIVNDFWGETAPPSDALTLNEKDPACAGVPVIAPEPASRFNPTGNCPLTTDHV